MSERDERWRNDEDESTVLPMTRRGWGGRREENGMERGERNDMINAENVRLITY